MKAIIVTDQAVGTAGMKLVERPEPQAAINDVVVVLLFGRRISPALVAWSLLQGTIALIGLATLYVLAIRRGLPETDAPTPAR
jgi:hypothetical protein